MRSHSSQGWEKPPMANLGWTQTSIPQGNLGNIFQKCLRRPKQFDRISATAFSARCYLSFTSHGMVAGRS